MVAGADVSLYNCPVRGAGIITVVSGGLPLLVAWVAGSTGLLESQRPVTDGAEGLRVLQVLKAAQRGGLPAVRHGRRVRFRRRDLLHVAKKGR